MKLTDSRHIYQHMLDKLLPIIRAVIDQPLAKGGFDAVGLGEVNAVAAGAGPGGFQGGAGARGVANGVGCRGGGGR